MSMSRFAASPEGQSPQDSLPVFLPLSPEIIDDSLASLHRDSRHMLAFIETARMHEPADRLFVNTLTHDNNWLERWHISNNDMQPNTEFYYRLGLLYGIDMAQMARRQMLVGQDLLATNPKAFAAAMEDIVETYRELDDSLTGWQRQKKRELQYTGSDVLTLANACFDTRMREHMHSDGIVETSPDGASSMHVGLVDGALFVAAYAMRQIGRKITPAAHPIEYVPTFDATRHVVGHGLSGAWTENMRTVRSIVQAALDQKMVPPYEYSDGLIDITVNELLVQTGPRTFILAGEISRSSEQLRFPRGIFGSLIVSSVLPRQYTQKMLFGA